MERRFVGRVAAGAFVVGLAFSALNRLDVFPLFGPDGLLALVFVGVVVTGWVLLAARDLEPSALRRVQAIVLAALLAVVLILPLGWFGTEVLRTYGYSLFLGLPFLLGFLAPLALAVLSGGAEVTRAEALSLGVTGGLLLMSVLLVLGLEGILCMLMALPIVLGFAGVGGLVGWLVLRSGRKVSGFRMLTVLAAAPFLMGVEARLLPPPPTFEVRSDITVAAPPEAVWEHVVSFSELPPPDDWLFATGVAYPLRAEIDGEGVGAVRRCVFSTGAFVEPVTVWDPPRRLAFTVTENPPSLEEWNPFHDVRPAHVEGFLVSERGEFRLEPLPDGGTRLVGITRYRHSLWPAKYWAVWSDWIIHRIHLRVLRHIAREAQGVMSDQTLPSPDSKPSMKITES